MNNIEFLKFNFTPGEKYLGIATVRYEKRFIFRFKLIPKDKSSGYYVQSAAYKINEDGRDTYVSAFSLDSSYEAEEMRDFIISNYERICSEESKKSVFSEPIKQPPGAGQPNPNNHHYSQQNTQAQEELPF